jgi:hypothetical protein
MLGAQAAYNDVRNKAAQQTAEVQAQAEGAYARALSSTSAMSGDVKSRLDKEYTKARARQAEHKGEKVVEKGKGWVRSSAVWERPSNLSQFSWLTGN